MANCQIKAVFGGLPVPSARRMAEELFIGKLDPKKIKAAIYQTKFWPVYQRDKVYTTGTGHAKSVGQGKHEASGTFSGSASVEFFQPQDWFSFSSPEPTALSAAQSSGSQTVSGTSSMEVETETESESVADIPIFVPVPFQELSSVQFYTPEEQLIELTAALKEQYQRHCFIKIHQNDTQPMLVPYVRNYYTPPRNSRWYEQKLLKQENALPGPEVDRLLEARDTALIEEIKKSDKKALPKDFRE
ncbi:hypothetical protein MYX82_10655 [Acidobacteria bacterium AH-259-D05]|nr:hypothetical protein [Acidobacteria bacterium AH-259-D05]